MTTQVQDSNGANVARFLGQRAVSDPDGLAVAAPKDGDFETWTWSALDQASASVAHGLARLGLRPGERACVFVKPGLDWIALIQGLFKLGAIPVLIDPGMGRGGMLAAIERVKPRALIAVPKLLLLRPLFASHFRSVEITVSSGTRMLAQASLETWLAEETDDFAAIEREPRDEAAILFTSGSTGPAKGVLYEHGMFQTQVEILRELYLFAPGSADLACFPLFALFGPALGLTSVFPDMDFSRPADCDPERIAQAIERFDVRSSFGSPAIWRRVIPWCEARAQRLDSLERLMIAGAAVEPDLVRRARALISRRGEVFTPYGATEALPVAHIEGVLLAGRLAEASARGAGTCIGRAAPGVEVRLIRIVDEPIDQWGDGLLVPAGDAGEICVRGKNVTREYEFEPEATALAKIPDGVSFWHRMGDLGRFDDEGLLWFLGRKLHRIETASGTMFPVPLENVFELHPAVGRCALVGVGPRGGEIPTLVIETSSGQIPKTARAREVLATAILGFAAGVATLEPIARVLFKKDFPLDVRHQAKIDRTALKAWAQSESP